MTERRFISFLAIFLVDTSVKCCKRSAPTKSCMLLRRQAWYTGYEGYKSSTWQPVWDSWMRMIEVWPLTPDFFPRLALLVTTACSPSFAHYSCEINKKSRSWHRASPQSRWCSVFWAKSSKMSKQFDLTPTTVSSSTANYASTPWPKSVYTSSMQHWSHALLAASCLQRSNDDLHRQVETVNWQSFAWPWTWYFEICTQTLADKWLPAYAITESNTSL